MGAQKLNNEQRNEILGDKLLASLSSEQYEIIEHGLEIIECFADYHLDTCFQSPFLPFLESAVHKLFMLLIDIKTPKKIHPKLCETLLPVLISIGKQKITQYLTAFVNNVCKNGQAQKQKLWQKFKNLLNKINESTQSKNAFPLDMKIKAEF